MRTAANYASYLNKLKIYLGESSGGGRKLRLK